MLQSRFCNRYRQSNLTVSLTWALIELSLHPEKQDKLRKELSEFANTDPTYDQLMNNLPFLDAVAREIIRLHPPVEQTNRVVRLICGGELMIVNEANLSRLPMMTLSLSAPRSQRRQANRSSKSLSPVIHLSSCPYALSIVPKRSGALTQRNSSLNDG